MQCFDTFRGFVHKIYAATMDGKGEEGTYNFSNDDWGQPGGQGIGHKGAAAPLPLRWCRPWQRRVTEKINGQKRQRRQTCGLYLAENDFWSEILGRATQRPRAAFYSFRKTEVGHLFTAALRKKQQNVQNMCCKILCSVSCSTYL